MQRYGPGTALIVVDVQNDFADPAGSLSVAGGGDDHPADQPRDRVGPRQRCHSSSRPRTGTRRVTPHFAKDGGIWPVHCVAGTWGAELYPDLALPDDAPRVRKGVNGEDGYSGFTMRDPLTGETVEDRARRTPARRRRGARRRRRPRDRLLRQGDRARRDRARLSDRGARPTPSPPVDLRTGDGDRAVAGLEAAGVGILRTVMR